MEKAERLVRLAGAAAEDLVARGLRLDHADRVRPHSEDARHSIVRGSGESGANPDRGSWERCR